MTPAAKGPTRVTWAIPGVVISPAKRAATPWLARPPATDSAIERPDSRVSIPITTSGEAWWSVTHFASATPTANVVGGSSGYSPATPRMPSVPKSFRILELVSRPLDRQFHGYLRRRLEVHLGIGDKGIHSIVAGSRQAAQVDRIGLNARDGSDSNFRARDAQPFWGDVLACQAVASRQGADELDLHGNLFCRHSHEAQTKLRWHGAQECHAWGQIKVGFGDR